MNWLDLPDPYFGPAGAPKGPPVPDLPPLREAYEQAEAYPQWDLTGKPTGTYRPTEEPCNGCGQPTKRRVIGAVRYLKSTPASMRLGLVLTPCCEQCERGTP